MFPSTRLQRRFAKVCAAIVWLQIGCSSAFAQIFDFTYTASGISATGTFYTTSLGGGQYYVNSITGTRNGVPITGLAPVGTEGSDNIIFSPAAPGSLSYGGVTYKTSNRMYNFYYSGGLNGIAGYGEITMRTNGRVLSETGLTSANIVARSTGAPGPIPGAGLLSFVVLGLGFLLVRIRSLPGLASRVVTSLRAAFHHTGLPPQRPPARDHNEIRA